MPEAVWFTYLLLGISVLLLVSVFASKASEKLGVPALLMFLLIGILLGSEGVGGIHFDDAQAAKFLGTMALAYILFAGGLDTDWKTTRSVLRPGIVLATFGVLLTAVLVAAFTVLVFNFSWLEGMLLGSVISSTDAAAVFSVLRSRSVSLKDNLRPLLELESGSNDPMAVFLTITMVGLINIPSMRWWSAFPLFAQQMLVGASIGVLLGYGIIYLLNNIKLEYEGLYPVLTVALVLMIYGTSEILGGNGFLSVYIAGSILGNVNFIRKRSLMRFHDGIAWLMQILMFLALGLLVFPSRLVPVIGTGLLLSAFLVLLGRPLAVMLCLIRSGFSLREKILISWVGLRGAVPIVLATFPLVAGIDRSDTIFNLVFFVVITSVVLQGKTLPIVARWLHLDRPLKRRELVPLEFERTDPNIKADMIEVIVPAEANAINKRIIELGFPPQALIVLIRRHGEYFIPYGGTVIEAGDEVLVLGEPHALKESRTILTCPKEEQD